MKVFDVNKFSRRWCMGIFICMYSMANICRALFQAQTSYYVECNNEKVRKQFHQPVFLNIIMSISMMPAILIELVHKKYYADKQTSTKIPKSIWLLLPIASFLDCCQCWSMNRAINDVGLSFGSLIVAFDLLFISLIKAFIIRAKMPGYAIFSVSIVIFSIILISIADHFSGYAKFDFSDSTSISTIIIQLIGEIFRSVLFVLQESIVHNTDMSPELFVGTVGLYDFAISLFIQTPIAYFINDPSWGNFYENMCHSFQLLFNSKQAIFACFTYLVVSFLMNVANTRYIYYTGAIQTSICAGFSASINWLISILVTAFSKGSDLEMLTLIFHEKWSMWSLLKIFSYIAILFALLVFSRAFQLPWFTYPEESRYIVTMDDI